MRASIHCRNAVMPSGVKFETLYEKAAGLYEIQMQAMQPIDINQISYLLMIVNRKTVMPILVCLTAHHGKIFLSATLFYLS